MTISTNDEKSLLKRWHAGLLGTALHSEWLTNAVTMPTESAKRVDVVHRGAPAVALLRKSKFIYSKTEGALMKISRRGTLANHGTSSIELKKLNISWDASENCVLIKTNGVKDFNTDSSHNYTIRLPIAELAKIIRVVGSDGVTLSAAGLETALEEETKALHRILAAATGLLTPVMIEED